LDSDNLSGLNHQLTVERSKAAGYNLVTNELH
jgi:hypothetical protein